MGRSNKKRARLDDEGHSVDTSEKSKNKSSDSDDDGEHNGGEPVRSKKAEARRRRKQRKRKEAKKQKSSQKIGNAEAWKSSGEEQEQEDESLIGFLHQGESLVLVGARSGVVFASERNDDGELVRIGKLSAETPPRGLPEWDSSTVSTTSIVFDAATNQQKAEKKEAKVATKDEPSSATSGAQQSASAAQLQGPLRPKRRTKPFGSYFPKALKVPGATLPPGNTCAILLFYQYAQPLWSEPQKQEAINYMAKLGAELNLGGRLRISREGFNCTLSGTRSDLDAFCESLRKWRPKNFSSTDFKFLENLPADKGFKDLDLFPVQEIVHYGLPPDLADKISEKVGEHLAPSDYHQKMTEKDTVIIDVRNAYETAIGRFAPPKGGAQFIDPNMRRSTDFQQFLEDPETAEKLAGKQVLMYCTGGVRCERASAMLNHKLGDQVKGVFQLQGGIEKYMKEFEGKGFWAGKNFTFDKRNANSAGEMFEDPFAEKETGILSTAKCVCCERPWDKYQGHRKCQDCTVPVIVCDRCRTERRDETNRRCDLCKQEFHYLADHDRAIANQLADLEQGGEEEGDVCYAAASFSNPTSKSKKIVFE